MNIGILGYGKMGKTIEGIAIQDKHNILFKINSKNTKHFNIESLKSVDVVIEFSRPECAYENIKFCLEHQVNVVSGTTGWMDKLSDVKQLATDNGCGFIYASNFSIGVNIFFEINQLLAKLMNRQQQYSAAVHEIHHTQKLDAPSGTGITLGSDIVKVIDRYQQWVTEGDQAAPLLSLTSERIDPAPGTHTVSFQSEVDTIEIKHIAHSRDGFARGAVLAAEWLHGKSGVYTMKDVLGI